MPVKRKRVYISPLARKLLIYVILCSTFFSLIAISFQLYFEYKKDVSEINKILLIIEKNYVPAISHSRYFLDSKQTEILMNGIHSLPNVSYIEIFDITDDGYKSIYSIGKKNENNYKTKEYDLIHNENDIKYKFAKLNVVIDYNYVNSRLRARFLTIIISNIIKMLFVSVCILLIFYFFTIRHLNVIENFVKTIRFDKRSKSSIKLNKMFFEGSNELDDIADTINNLQTRIHESYSALKLSESNLTSALNDKDVLLKELYHRTKNNMQVISSLLHMQAMKIPGNNEVQKLVKVTQNRILAMSMVHKMLYQSLDLSNINIKKYFETLSTEILAGYLSDDLDIRLHLDIIDISVSFELAIPLGIILNELITNSLNDAFIEKTRGEISIVFQKNKDADYFLQVSDDGCGFKEDFEVDNSEGIGVQLVFSLVRHQLGGTISMDGNMGAKYIITIPKNIFTEKTN